MQEVCKTCIENNDGRRILSEETKERRIWESTLRDDLERVFTMNESLL